MNRLLLAFFIFFQTALYAQESPFNQFSSTSFNIKYDHLDSQANAVVMEEIGNSKIQVVEADRGVRIIHNYAVRIKIINKEGFNKANFTIPLYKIGGDFEYIQEMKGITYNLEGSKVIKTELNKSQIFTEKYSEFVQLSKFTFPDIREGSVIELHYTLVSPDIFNFRTWKFQEDIPKLASQYIAEIPANYTYHVSLVGPYKLTDQKSKILRECFVFNGIRMDCSQLFYTLKDIPAFVEEDYMLAPKNYLAAIKFELLSFQDGRGANYKYTKDWKDVDRELLNDKEIGGQLKKTSAFKSILPNLIKEDDTPLDKAKAIFAYIKNQIKWNNYYGFNARYGVEEALIKRTGNVADINLSLAAGLLAADIETYPVLLSTRENGLPNNLHPIISDFNYLIVLAIIDGEQFLLDATNKHLPFGELPLRAINHNGRVVYSKKSSDWLPMINTKVSKTSYSFDGELCLDGYVKGNLVAQFTGLDALNRRNEISKYSSDEEYKEYWQSYMPNTVINSMEINNIDNPEETLSLVLNIHFKLFNDSIHDKKEINLNAILLDLIKKNPFNLDDRTYPVDLGSMQEQNHSIILKMPKEFKLHEKPKDISLSLPEKAARYSYKTVDENNIITVKQTINLNKNIYDIDEYFHLKEFYSRIIQQQKLELTFIKAND